MSTHTYSVAERYLIASTLDNLAVLGMCKQLLFELAFLILQHSKSSIFMEQSMMGHVNTKGHLVLRLLDILLIMR
jgi:hypothetical protein